MQKSLKNTLVAGLAAGLISGLVKLGWENILPPRTPQCDAVNPPQTFLQQLGIPAKITQSTYSYSGHQMPWASFLVHFGFSVTFATTYALALEKKVTWLTKKQGLPFGVAMWITFHLVIMPAMKTIPTAKRQPLAEHVSEILGHMFWMYTNHEVAKEILDRLDRK